MSWGKDSDFIGKTAALSECRQVAKRTLVIFEFDADGADVVAYEPVLIDGGVRVFCTSVEYSHFAQKSISIELIPSNNATESLQVEIEILSKMHHAKRITMPFLYVCGGSLITPVFHKKWFCLKKIYGRLLHDYFGNHNFGCWKIVSHARQRQADATCAW